MKTHRKITLTVLTVVAVALIGSFAVLSSQGKDKQRRTTIVELRPAGQDGQPSTTEVSPVPVTEYGAARAGDTKRKAKNKRYKNKLPAAIDPEGNDLPVASTVHWWAGLSALPVDRSDAVVIGHVSDAEAFIAEGNTGLYSEFTISLDEVLKGEAAGSIVAERMGGAVKFANGRTRAFRLSGMGFPRVGRQYLFFLSRNADGVDYTILTAYELRGGKIFPLDGEGKKLHFSAYAGADADAFLNEVRAALSPASQAENN